MLTNEQLRFSKIFAIQFRNKRVEFFIITYLMKSNYLLIDQNLHLNVKITKDLEKVDH